MARKVVRMPSPRLGRALEDVRIKNAAVAPTIVVDRRSERSPRQLGYRLVRSILSTTPSMLAALNLRARISFITTTPFLDDSKPLLKKEFCC